MYQTLFLPKHKKAMGEEGESKKSKGGPTKHIFLEETRRERERKGEIVSEPTTGEQMGWRSRGLFEETERKE